MPFAFVTGYGREALPEAFRHAPLLNKPPFPKSAFDMLEKLLSKETPHIGPTPAKDKNLTSKLRQKIGRANARTQVTNSQLEALPPTEKKHPQTIYTNTVQNSI